MAFLFFSGSDSKNFYVFLLPVGGAGAIRVGQAEKKGAKMNVQCGLPGGSQFTYRWCRRCDVNTVKNALYQWAEDRGIRNPRVTVLTNEAAKKARYADKTRIYRDPEGDLLSLPER